MFTLIERIVVEGCFFEDLTVVGHVEIVSLLIALSVQLLREEDCLSENGLRVVPLVDLR